MINEKPRQTGELPSKENLTAEQREQYWYDNVYQGDSMPQLTLRSVFMGMILGSVMSLSNLYVGLKTGWAFGVSITACILSFAIWTSLRKLLPRLFKTDMSILENNAMQSTATAAGVSTGGTMVSAIAAYLLITGHHMNFWILTAWTFLLAMLGVMMAIPMKRQMINIEQLRFPSGIATATTLKSLHAKGQEAVAQAKSLFVSGGLGAFMCMFRDMSAPWWKLSFIPSQIPIPFLRIAGTPAIQYTFAFEGSLLMVAGGALMGTKVASSLLLGAIIHYGFLAPWIKGLGGIHELSFGGIMKWGMWPGAAIMVSSGLVSFAMQGKTIARAFSGIGNLFGKKSEKTENPMDRIEVPQSWFIWGTGLSGLGCVLILALVFHTKIWMGILAVLMTFFLSLVACRATGETDTTPIGAMGKVTQLTYGILAPGNMITNLMTAGVTAGAAGASADLLTDLKSGYILGANPRKQFLAQFAGVFAGTIAVVPAFYLMVPNAAVLNSTRFPAPSAHVWEGVARLLSNGFSSLHPTAQIGLLVGVIIGSIIPLLEKFAPEKVKPFIPSPMGLGLAMVIPAYNSISMFIGAMIAMALEKKAPKIAETYTVPVSSGIIAGESLMGVAIAILTTLGILG